MKIVIVNGSHRKNGATARILQEIEKQLRKYEDVDIQVYHVSDMDLHYCIGCSSCYRTGECIYKDDAEKMSLELQDADGVILGSPTYASNVSGQMKVIIDRGHFVMKQLLYGKYGISVATYENHGGKSVSKILNRILTYSGAKISGTIVSKNEFNANPLEDVRLEKSIQKITKRLYRDITKKHRYIFQDMKHWIVFQVGIKPFVLRKGPQYDGVVRYWREKNMAI